MSLDTVDTPEKLKRARRRRNFGKVSDGIGILVQFEHLKEGAIFRFKFNPEYMIKLLETPPEDAHYNHDFRFEKYHRYATPSRLQLGHVTDNYYYIPPEQVPPCP
jgi:hypothetical protein